jgi:hypothetical protein
VKKYKDAFKVPSPSAITKLGSFAAFLLFASIVSAQNATFTKITVHSTPPWNSYPKNEQNSVKSSTSPKGDKVVSPEINDAFCIESFEECQYEEPLVEQCLNCLGICTGTGEWPSWLCYGGF